MCPSRGQNLGRRLGGGRPGAPTHDPSGRRRCSPAQACGGDRPSGRAATGRGGACRARDRARPGRAHSRGRPVRSRKRSVGLSRRSPCGKAQPWRRPLSTQRGARSTCLPPHSRTRLRLFRSPLPRRQSFFRTRRTVPPTWHSIRPRSLRPLPGCMPSSRAGSASTQLASRRITVQSLAPAEPFLPPTPPDSGPSSTSTSPKPSATGTDGQNTKKEPKPRPTGQPTPATVNRPARSNRRLRRRQLLRSSRRNPWPRRALPCRTPPPSSSNARERRRARISRTSRSPRRRLLLRLRLRRRRPRRRRPLPDVDTAPLLGASAVVEPPALVDAPGDDSAAAAVWGHPTRQWKWRPEPRPHGTTRALRQRQRAPPLRLPASRAGDGSRTLRSPPRNRPPP